MPATQKTEEMLLILSNEERDAAEDFILKRLRLLDSEALTDLELVAGSARTVLDRVRENAHRIDSSSRAGKVLSRIYTNAQEGFAHLIKECNLAVSQKKREQTTTDEEGEDEGQQNAPLPILEIEPDDEEHAWSVIEASLVEIETQKIRELRDATEELLGWWQTDNGMHESQHIDQYGDVNTANGRMAIRKAREDFEQQEIGPFRSFFQTINLIYQKKNQEAQRVLRKEKMRQEAGLGD